MKKACCFSHTLWPLQDELHVQVVANGLRSITSHHAWDGGSRQQVTLQELRAGQQASGAQLLLLSGLLDELGSSSLQEVATPAVLQAVSQEASSLPRSLAPSALAKVLTATVRSVVCVQELVTKVSVI